MRRLRKLTSITQAHKAISFESSKQYRKSSKEHIKKFHIRRCWDSRLQLLPFREATS